LPTKSVAELGLRQEADQNEVESLHITNYHMNATTIPAVSTKEEQLQIELDPETFAEVERLANESNVSPFEMCVILLRERFASSAELSPQE
jgi:hypothetical protein